MKCFQIRSLGIPNMSPIKGDWKNVYPFPQVGIVRSLVYRNDNSMSYLSPWVFLRPGFSVAWGLSGGTSPSQTVWKLGIN